MFQGATCPRCGQRASPQPPDVEDLALQWLEGQADDATLPPEWLKGEVSERPTRKARDLTSPKRLQGQPGAGKPLRKAAQRPKARDVQSGRSKQQAAPAGQPPPRATHSDRGSMAPASNQPPDIAPTAPQRHDEQTVAPPDAIGTEHHPTRRLDWVFVAIILGAAAGFFAGQYAERARVQHQIEQLKQRVEIHRAWLQEEIKRRNRLEAEMARLQYSITRESSPSEHSER